MRQTLTEALYFSRSRYVEMLRIVWPLLALPMFVGIPVSHLSGSLELFWMYTMTLWLIQPYFRCRLIKYLDAVANNKPYNRRVSFTEWSRLLLVYLVCGIAIGIGFMAFVIPGLFLALRYGFVEFEVVQNGRSTMRSISESWKNTKTEFWLLVKGSALILMVPVVSGFLLAVIGNSSAALSLLTGAISEVIFFASMMVLLVFYYRVFQVNQNEG